MKIVADDKIPYLKGALEQYAEVTYLPGAKITTKDLKDADALITRTRTKCNQQLLDSTSIKFIATATIGYDHIDTEYCNNTGIKWTNAPGCNSGSVMQYIASTLISLAIKHNFELSDKTIGIVGVGNVGKKISEFCDALGMKVLLNDPPRAREEGSEQFKDLKTLIQQADILTFHTPLIREGIDKTFHLVNKENINLFNENQILINSSRGEVFDNTVIKKALKSKKIKATVLDVWENEPNINLELLNLVDFGTPHIAGYSADGKANGTSMSVQAISKFFNLGIDNWEAKNVPLPNISNINIDCKNKTSQQVVSECILHTYKIENDYLALESAPETFENLRGNYPLRREFGTYTISLNNNNNNGVANTLKKIGFKTVISRY